MKVSFQFLFSFLFFTTCQSQASKEIFPEIKLLDKEIPFYFGLNNDYPKTDSMLIRLTDPEGKQVIEKKGYHPVWGLLKEKSLQLSGRYIYHVVFYSDSSTVSEFTNYFDVNGDEERLDFSINLSYFLQDGADIYINKYYDNKYNAELVRDWNPIIADSLANAIQPFYILKNNYDSTLYGIYRVFSSSFLTHWVRLHSTAYSQIQKWQADHWENLQINSCPIQAELKKGSSGKTYEGSNCKATRSQLGTPGKYRIAVEYGINDAITRYSDSLSKDFPNRSYEAHVYQCYDEFELH